MANFSKSFNFRGGFQVDTDVLVVRGQNVGIGSSIPSERLDVDGIVKAQGLIVSGDSETVIDKGSAGVLTVTEQLDVGIETGSALPYPQGSPQVRITTGIITAANPAIGVVTYYGDGGRLLNLPTSQWLDVDVGLGFTSIYAQGYVGVDTTDPRYVFQVGGVPFAPKAGFTSSQTGVGIEGGAVYASGIITAGSNISAGATIYAGREFIGVGSNISILNADNIAIGSIGSMRYGSVIVTDEVIATNFTGIASFAVDVLPDSDLVYESGRADTITAVTRFISTEGGISIGHNDPPSSNLGDIDLNKTDDASDSTIYSVTDVTSTARIFAGHEREGGVRNSFGGFRFGGNVSGSPTSGANDLDVVNYDVGNVNFVLHDGNIEGGTTGEFRWIYGQFDTIPMTLDASGKLTLTGNLTPTEPSLSVVGVSSFVGVTNFVGEVTTSTNVVIGGDLSVGGDLTFGTISIGDTITAPGVNVSDKIVVGTEGGDGVVLTADGDVTISESLQVSTNVLVNNTGINLTGGAINAPTAVFTTATITTLNATDISASGFNVTGGTTTIDTLSVSGITGSLPDFSVNTITATNVNTGDITASSGTIDGLDATNLDVSSTGTFLNLNATTGNIQNLTADTLSLSQPLELNSLNVNTIASNPSGSTVSIADDLSVGQDSNGVSINVAGEITGVSTLRATSAVLAGPLLASRVSAGSSNIFITITSGYDFDPQEPTKVRLTFEGTVSGIQTTFGQVTLTYDT